MSARIEEARIVRPMPRHVKPHLYAAEVVSLKRSDSEIQRQQNCWKKERNPNSKADTRVTTAAVLSLSHSIRDDPYSTCYTVRKILPVSLSVSHRLLIY